MSDFIERFYDIFDIKSDKLTISDIVDYRNSNKYLLDKCPSVDICENNKVYEELKEVISAYHEKDIDHLEDECGDLLMITIAFIQKCGINPNLALTRGFDKLQRRLDVIKNGGTWNDAKIKHPK